VVDDCSNDETASIANTLADTVISTGQTPRGPAFSRNRGAAVTRSENIAFVDSDVSVHRDALRLMLETLDGEPGYDAVFGSYDDTPSDPSTVSQYRNLLHHYVHSENAGETATFWAGCGALRKDAFDRAGKFDEARYPRPQIEDIELGYRLRSVGARILLDPLIQCTHHKRWKLHTMLETDMRDRAIPWVKLLLSTPGRGNSQNPSLGMREVTGSLSMLLALVFAVLALTRFTIAGIIGAIACVATSLWVNRDLYLWFARMRGNLFAAEAVILHLMYQLVSAVAAPIGIATYVYESAFGPGRSK
jgi:Glycosyltransferases, probably involved in cell wall biogenesis